MGKIRLIGFFIILVLVSNTGNASVGFPIRRLLSTAPNNASTTPLVSPVGSPFGGSNANPVNPEKPVEEKPNESQMKDKSDNKTSPADPNGEKNENESNANPVNPEKPVEEKQKEPQMKDKNDNKTSPADSNVSKKNESKNAGAPAQPDGEKNDSKIDEGNTKAGDENMPKLDSGSSCDGSMTSCSDNGLRACIVTSKDGGSAQVFLVVQNEGENTLEISVKVPNSLGIALPAFKVPKHEIRRTDMSSIVGKSNELIVDSGIAKCELHLVRPVSVDNLIQQLSFYSKQVTPIYAVYASFLVALVFGGTLVCCKLRKKNNRHDGIPYQELELGLPGSAPAVNDDAAEGWDDNWDDDDWDEGNAVKSPSGNVVRNVSADGLIVRSSKKDNGWEVWED